MCQYTCKGVCKLTTAAGNGFTVSLQLAGWWATISQDCCAHIANLT